MTWSQWQVLRVVGLASLMLIGVALVLGVGYYVPQRPAIALLAALFVCLFGLTLMDSAIVPLLMTIPVLVSMRVVAGGVDLSLSDAALFLAFFPALFFAERPWSPAMRSMVWFGVIYQASILFTVVANPYTANVVEWVHSGLLTIGALVVGWSIGREGHARLGMTLLLLGSSAVAVIAIVTALIQYSHGNFDAVYPNWPYPLHKNAIGCLCGLAAGIAYARPPWVRWPTLFAQVNFWIAIGGILAAQSRQALVGLAVALVVITLRSQGSSKERRSKIILLAALPAVGIVASLVQSQIASGKEYNSFFQRIEWFKKSIEIWQSDPLFGVGLRWWYTDRFEERFQPPNVVMEQLSTAGIFGLAGFVLMVAGCLVVLWRIDPTYGLVAFTVLLNRLVQGQLDLFWVAVQTSIPFLVAGIALGALARDRPPLPPGLGPSVPAERAAEAARA